MYIKIILKLNLFILKSKRKILMIIKKNNLNYNKLIMINLNNNLHLLLMIKQSRLHHLIRKNEANEIKCSFIDFLLNIFYYLIN